MPIMSGVEHHDLDAVQMRKEKSAKTNEREEEREGQQVALAERVERKGGKGLTDSVRPGPCEAG